MVVRNQVVKATANHSARTFTLRTYVNGKFSAKYRTYPTSQEEFNLDLYNTENDWKQFLKTDNYYKVK